MRKEYYKFYPAGENDYMPRPLYLGYTNVAPPFDSLNFKPPKRYYLFMYTLAGCGLLQQSGKVKKLPPGTAFLYKFPDENYRFFLNDDMGEWLTVYLEFNAGDMERTLDSLIDENKALFELSPDSGIINKLLAYREKFYERGHQTGFDGTTRHFHSSIPVTMLEGAQLVYRLMSELQTYESANQRGNHNIVNKACEYINSHIDQSFDVGKMAKKLAVSRGHLTRVFTEKMGIPPHDYINRLKMRRACQLLSSSNMTVEEIAEKTGTGSGIYFYRAFKKMTGLTPGEFRESGHQEEIIKSL